MISGKEQKKRAFLFNIYAKRNYGIEKGKDVKYFDAEILLTKLPFKGRKKSEKEKINDAYLLRHQKSLEGAIYSIIMIVGIILLGFNLLSMTGNIISNLTQTTLGMTGLIFFILGLIGIFLSLRKNKNL